MQRDVSRKAFRFKILLMETLHQEATSNHLQDNQTFDGPKLCHQNSFRKIRNMIAHWCACRSSSPLPQLLLFITLFQRAPTGKDTLQNTHCLLILISLSVSKVTQELHWGLLRQNYANPSSAATSSPRSKVCLCWTDIVRRHTT